MQILPLLKVELADIRGEIADALRKARREDRAKARFLHRSLMASLAQFDHALVQNLYAGGPVGSLNA